MKPDILDPRWKYVRAIDTDIRKRFEEAKAKLEAEKSRSIAIAEEAQKIVAKIRIKGKI